MDGVTTLLYGFFIVVGFFVLLAIGLATLNKGGKRSGRSSYRGKKKSGLFGGKKKYRGKKSSSGIW